MARNRSIRVVRPNDQLEIIKMAEYIFKHSKNAKEVNYYTEQIDALDYQFYPNQIKHRNFNNKHTYTYKVKDIDSNNIDNSTHNEVLKESQHLDRRKHLISSHKLDKQPERSKKPAYDVQNNNMLQKTSRETIKSRKKFKIEKVFTAKYLKSPENMAKRRNGNKTNNHNVLRSTADSKSKDILENMTNLTKEHLRQSVTADINDDNYTYYPPEISKYIFSQIPRFNSSLSSTNAVFALTSQEYQFVSSFFLI